MIGWKKAYKENVDDVCIVKLSIPKKARIVQTPKGYWRCSEAKVLGIHSIDGRKEYTIARSMKDTSFKYITGLRARSDFDLSICSCYFCGDPIRESGPGIYFFKTLQEAIDYEY